jgi:hypothetical protein
MDKRHYSELDADTSTNHRGNWDYGCSESAFHAWQIRVSLDNWQLAISSEVHSIHPIEHKWFV